MDAVYVPETGMISMATLLDDGVQAEVGVIGVEGMLGSSLVSGVQISFVEAFVRMPGTMLAWKRVNSSANS